MTKTSTLLILSVFLFLACSSPVKPLLIDNPSDKVIDVYINNRKYMIPSREQIIVDVPYGKLTYKVNEEETQKVRLNSKKLYLLNPLKEDYYIEDIQYFNSMEEELKYRERHGVQRSTVEQFEVPGNYKKIPSSVLIERNWTIGLDKGRQHRIRVDWRNVNSSPVVVRKIHRKSDLIDEFVDTMFSE